MFKRIQRLIRPLIEGVKKGLMLFLLFFAYLFVFGPTAVFMKVFRRDLLPRPFREGQVRWLDAVGFEPSGEDLSRQA